jgi:DNA-binding transcriptional LysR family regulator
MKPIQFLWIEAFRAVAMTGSTVDGAQLLGVDQSAISRRVAALETQLGLKLFERVNRRLILTAAGTELLGEAEAAVEALERFLRRGMGLRAPMSGHLHVVTSSTLARGLLPPALKTFRDAFPEATIEVEVVSRSELEARIERQNFDLAGIALQLSYLPGHTVRLGAFDAVAVLPRDHPLADQETVRLEDLAQETLVGLPLGAIGRARIEDLFQRHGFAYAPRIETTAAALNEMVGVGLGVAISDPFTAEVLETKALSVRRLAPTVSYEFAVLLPLARPRSAITNAFISALEARVEASA